MVKSKQKISWNRVLLRREVDVQYNHENSKSLKWVIEGEATPLSMKTKSHFSTAEWFCHFPKLRRQLYSVVDDKLYIKPHLEKKWLHLEQIVDSFVYHTMKASIPECPDSFCTISLVCKFQMYTKLSSEPLTIHLPPVTEKLAKIQYFSFLCPV